MTAWQSVLFTCQNYNVILKLLLLTFVCVLFKSSQSKYSSFGYRFFFHPILNWLAKVSRFDSTSKLVMRYDLTINSNITMYNYCTSKVIVTSWFSFIFGRKQILINFQTLLSSWVITWYNFNQIVWEKTRYNSV